MRVNRMTPTQALQPQGVALTGTCPTCHGTFETCRCTGGVAVLVRCATTVPAPAAAGGYGGWEDDDNQRDETDQFNRLVRQLVDDGDERAAVAGRRARRTLAEMAPGQTLQPVLRMTRPLAFAPTVSRAGAADDACGLCGYWTCRCGSSAAPARSVRAVAS